jgi:hypothetical protein
MLSLISVNLTNVGFPTKFVEAISWYTSIKFNLSDEYLITGKTVFAKYKY